VRKEQLCLLGEQETWKKLNGVHMGSDVILAKPLRVAFQPCYSLFATLRDIVSRDSQLALDYKWYLNSLSNRRTYSGDFAVRVSQVTLSGGCSSSKLSLTTHVLVIFTCFSLSLRLKKICDFNFHEQSFML
jgi:hypothetical protein